MARYRPYVDAVQWTGTNVTEIRQFVRVSDVLGVPSISGTNLVLNYLLATDSPTIVAVGDWVVRSGTAITTYSQAAFDARFEADI
jgi:hypothetical protein